MPDWRTRAQTVEDGDFVAALFIDVRGAEFAALPLPPEAKRALLMQQSGFQVASYRAAHPDADWRIVERDSAPIGRLVVDRSGAPWSLIDISLLDVARGGGIGTALLSGLQDEARAVGAAIHLHVDAASPARRLYTLLGFAETGEAAGHRLGMLWRPQSGRR